MDGADARPRSAPHRKLASYLTTVVDMGVGGDLDPWTDMGTVAAGAIRRGQRAKGRDPGADAAGQLPGCWTLDAGRWTLDRVPWKPLEGWFGACAQRVCLVSDAIGKTRGNRE